MKGKSLYLLIDELNKAERHQLLNSCKRSGDKRQIALYNLVKKWTGAIDTFEKLLDTSTKDLFEGKKDAKEEDKVQRRFIDFSIKEIEHVKLKNYLTEDHLTRNYLLTKVYNEKRQSDINDRYLHKLGELAKEQNSFSMYELFLERMIEKTSSIHTKKETQLLHDLLIEKNALIQKNYHSDLSGIYNLISLLQLEDKDLLKELKGLILTNEELEVLIELAAGSSEEIIYLTARARFHFYDHKKFLLYYENAHYAIKKLKGNHQKHLAEELALLRILFGLHHAEPATTLVAYSSELENSNSGTNLFYFHLIRLIDLFNRNKPLPDIKDVNKIYSEPENVFRREFLIALLSFMKKDYSTALKRLNELSYINHPQVSSWSRLLELNIHIKKENYSLCDSLIGRMNRFFQSNKTKEFTAPSNKLVFTQLQQRLKARPLSQKKAVEEQGISCLHKIMLA